MATAYENGDCNKISSAYWEYKAVDGIVRYRNAPWEQTPGDNAE